MTEQQQAQVWDDSHIDIVLDQDFMEYQGEFWSKTVTARQIIRDCRDDMQAALDAAQARIADLEAQNARFVARIAGLVSAVWMLEDAQEWEPVRGRINCFCGEDGCNKHVRIENDSHGLSTLWFFAASGREEMMYLPRGEWVFMRRKREEVQGESAT